MSELSNVYVALMGMGTVFFGLICIVVLCKIMSMVMKTAGGKESPQQAAVPAAAAAPQTAAAPAAPAASFSPVTAANRQELIAASCVAIAEMEGISLEHIRVHSFRQLGGEVTGPERPLLLAAACTAIAETLGTGVENLRVHSFRRVS